MVENRRSVRRTEAGARVPSRSGAVFPAFEACIESEHAGYDRAQFLGKRDLPLSAAVGTSGVMVDLHVGVKGAQTIRKVRLAISEGSTARASRDLGNSER
jgi:hypothetical protein